MKTLSFNRITIAAIAILFSTIIFSCQKESSLGDNQPEITEEEATALSDESTQAEASFDDVEDVSMIAAEEEGEASANTGAFSGQAGTNNIRPYLPSFDELRLRLGSCATVTVVPNNNTYPKTITIDFGDGCICADGKFRKGAVIIHLTGPIRRSGSVMTISLRNFFLNRAHIEGTKVISNLSENGNIKFTVQVTGGAVTFPNGRGYQYQTLKYVKQVEGGGTNIIRDDVYSIEGRSQTQFNNGLTVTLNTESPLIKKVSCHWISDGLLKIKINNRVLFLNYGAPSNGDCDNKALLTWNNGNNQRLITLP
ncbi:hypothetical protein CAP36_00490 [Chitinophagaceae bacterium IBVUCB2]|nr:hypothetical protein CAP36_00490 [Chitinophagaceae bacterium IBVUCB2]